MDVNKSYYRKCFINWLGGRNYGLLNAVLNRMLIKDFNISMEETGIYPLQTYVEIRMDRTRSDRSVARKVKELEELNEELPYRMNLTPRK